MTSKTNTSFGKRLNSCSCIADARKVMRETRGVGPAVTKLVETAFALRDQPDIRSDMLKSAIAEMDKPFAADLDKGNKDIDKLGESGDIVSGSGTEGSEQSSDTVQPYPKEGTDEEVTDLKSATGEDQMKESHGGMMPPQTQMSTGGMPPVAPQLMQGMTPQLPNGLNPAMMEQMQFTVQEALKTPLQIISQLREAVKLLDTRLRETETNKASMTLNVDDVRGKSQAGSLIRETSVSPMSMDFPTVKFDRMRLQETRNDIYDLDQAMG